MTATPPYKQCARNMCVNMVDTSKAKYCSTRCQRASANARYKARRDVPFEKAVEGNTQYVFKKLMKSAAYLSDTYKVDREEAKEALIADMERKFDEFWGSEVVGPELNTEAKSGVA